MKNFVGKLAGLFGGSFNLIGVSGKGNVDKKI